MLYITRFREVEARVLARIDVMHATSALVQQPRGDRRPLSHTRAKALVRPTFKTSRVSRIAIAAVDGEDPVEADARLKACRYQAMRLSTLQRR